MYESLSGVCCVLSLFDTKMGSFGALPHIASLLTLQRCFEEKTHFDHTILVFVGDHFKSIVQKRGDESVAGIISIELEGTCFRFCKFAKILSRLTRVISTSTTKTKRMLI